MGHILQRCPRTHGLRIERHDRVKGLVAGMAQSRGWKVLVEPVIRTSQGRRKPDLILTRSDQDGSKAYIADVSIVADLEGAFVRTQMDKKQRYGVPPIRAGRRARASPEITEFTRTWTGNSNTEVSVIGLVWNWRGLVDPETAYFLIDVLKLRKSIFATASIRILEKGQKNWRAWSDST